MTVFSYSFELHLVFVVIFLIVVFLVSSTGTRILKLVRFRVFDENGSFRLGRLSSSAAFSAAAAAATTTKGMEIKSCPNPDCVRCRKYKRVQRNALSRLPWVVKDLKQQQQLLDDDGGEKSNSMDRVISSIRAYEEKTIAQLSQTILRNPLQDPTVLMVSGISAKEIVTDQHEETCRYICCQDRSRLVEDLLQNVPDDCWTYNDTPQGSWKVLSLLNQGSWNENVLQIIQSPAVVSFLRNIPNLLDGCLFGNLFVSTIFPGTRIEPHCGPTNVRHRLQYVLKLPQQSTPQAAEKGTTTKTAISIAMSQSENHGRYSENQQQEQQQHLKVRIKQQSPNLFMRVGAETVFEWNQEGDYFVFDDSFVHAVEYAADPDDHACTIVNDAPAGSVASSMTPPSHEQPKLSRMVLIVDLWHPDLNDMERRLIQALYPSFSSSTSSPPSSSSEATPSSLSWNGTTAASSATVERVNKGSNNKYLKKESDLASKKSS